IFSIPVFARIVRGSTLETRKLEYIDAMKALGASDFRIIFKHILPNVSSPIIVQATLNIATAVLTASGLSFLGLGAQPPMPEWGAMLSDGRNYLYNAPHVAFFPGVMIVAVVLAFNILGDGLRDVLETRMNKQIVFNKMFRYIFRRLLQTIPVLIGVSISVFSLMHRIPGDPSQIMAGESAPKEQVENMRERLGLNDPYAVQYWNFISNAVQGDLGNSIRSGRDVSSEIG